ncbi:hypothetical protein BR93DRAFT_531562 [Coniochaeta sp. PMI_546]|nr:hypothetical protein BR93DRAFT_531562 [Coniochaeta sp. PMI_546]
MKKKSLLRILAVMPESNCRHLRKGREVSAVLCVKWVVIGWFELVAYSLPRVSEKGVGEIGLRLSPVCVLWTLVVSQDEACGSVSKDAARYIRRRPQHSISRNRGRAEALHPQFSTRSLSCGTGAEQQETT